MTLVEPSLAAGPVRAAMGGRARAARWLADPRPEHVAVAVLLLVVLGLLARAGGGRDSGAAAWAALLSVPALLLSRPWQRLPARALGLVAVTALAALAVVGLTAGGRVAGVAALGYVVALAAAVVVAAYARTPGRRSAVAGLVCVGAVAQFAWALVPWWGAGDPSRPMVGTYAWHNQYAAALLCPALLGLALVLDGRRPWRSAGWLAAPLSVAGVVLSTSRATLGLLVVGWVAVLTLTWWRADPGRERSRVAARALVLTVVAVGLTVVLPGPPLFSTSASPLAGAGQRSAAGETLDVNGTYRTQFWRESLVVFRAHPLAGAGYGRTAAEVAGQVPSGWAVSSLAHSGPLQALADGGLLLAVPLLLLLGGAGLALLRRLRPRGDPLDRVLVPAAVVASLLLAAHSLVDTDWSYPALAAQAAIVAGLALAAPGPRGRPAPAPGRGALVACLVLVGALVVGSGLAWGQPFHINAPRSAPAPTTAAPATAAQTTAAQTTAAQTSGGGHS